MAETKTIVDEMTPEERAKFGNFKVAGQQEPDSEDAQRWPDPVDEAALHGVIGDIVRKIEPHTEADPHALLFQSLAMFGNAAGRTAYFQVEADRHFSNLYMAIVGQTSKARKGTSKGQVAAVFRAVDEQWEQTRQFSGLSSGEGVIWGIRDPIYKSEPIKEKGRVVEYQKVMIDEGIPDKRLLVMEPEFASTLRVLGRDGSTLSAILRNGWDTGNLRNLTKNSPIQATDAHISVIGHITQEELRRYLDSTEVANGFANRFLLVCVRRSKCLPEGGRVQDEDFSSIVRRLGAALDFARKAGQVTFDEATRKRWHAVYPDLSEGGPGLFGAITGRAEAQVVRLALIYALLDCSDRICEPHLFAALALWEYCAQSAAYVFGDSTGDPIADEILMALRRSLGGLTRTQISALFNRNRTATQIGGALSGLVRHGKVRCEFIETEGRTAEVWFAVGR